MKKYEVTTEVKSLGVNVTEIEAESLLEAQTKVLKSWHIKINQLQNKEDFSQSVDERFNSLRMTMLCKWEIVITEK